MEKKDQKLQEQQLLKEFKDIGYGLKLKCHFSKQAQKYLTDRHNKGIKELKSNGKYPIETGENGYTSLLGVWKFTKSRGLNSAIGIKKIWMATILNNPL